MAKMIYFVISGCFLEDNLITTNSCANAMNSIAKVTNSIAKGTNSFAKVMNSIAKGRIELPKPVISCTTPACFSNIYRCAMVPTLAENSKFSVYLFVNFFVNNYYDWRTTHTTSIDNILPGLETSKHHWLQAGFVLPSITRQVSLGETRLTTGKGFFLSRCFGSQQQFSRQINSLLREQ